MIIYPIKGNNLWTKGHYLLLLVLMTTGIQKVAMDPCVFISQVLVLKEGFVPLKFSSTSKEYNQIFQSFFG